MSLLLREKHELTKFSQAPRKLDKKKILHTFGGIPFDELDLISPWMQGAVLITISKGDCSFLSSGVNKKDVCMPRGSKICSLLFMMMFL